MTGGTCCATVHLGSAPIKASRHGAPGAAANLDIAGRCTNPVCTATHRHHVVGSSAWRPDAQIFFYPTAARPSPRGYWGVWDGAVMFARASAPPRRLPHSVTPLDDEPLRILSKAGDDKLDASNGQLGASHSLRGLLRSLNGYFASLGSNVSDGSP
jgi:hypothetical protein